MKSSVVDLAPLFRLFWGQFLARSLMGVIGVSVVVAALLLLTSPLDSWWFAALSWLQPVGQFLRSSESWDLFVLIFLVAAFVSFVQRLILAVVERHNYARLRTHSRDAIDAAPDTARALQTEKQLLNIRRLTLGGLLLLAGATSQLLALSIWMLVVGLPVSAVSVLVVGVVALLSLPYLMKRFIARKPKAGQAVDDSGTGAEEPAGRRTAIQRLETQYQKATVRLGFVASRPLLRIRGAWPVLAICVVGGATIATETVIAMSGPDGPGERGALLLVLLVLTGRSVLTVAQALEEVSFFASGAIMQASDDGE